MSTIENAKKAMDWTHPNDRQSCGNCAHVVVDDALRFSRPALRCKPGGFFTHRHAICGDYEPHSLTGSAPK